jgi:PAS domain S-box-containing protein
MALIALAAWGLARRERALAHSWKRYQAMIEHSADALILSRPLSGGISYASPAIERVLGYRVEDLRGREVMDLIHPDNREAAMRLRAELLRAPGKVSIDETKVLHKDGSWRWIELTRKNLLEEPSVRAVVFNFRDITERKQAEAERLRLEGRLRQAEKMEAVGRLAGGIAHDFNNILGGILGYAEMLAENAPQGSPLRRYAENVLTGANRASGLVEQILSYSRSQRGKRAPVDLGHIVEETLELVRGSLPGGIRLEAALPAAAVFVVGDATQLHQVTMNLCTNAIHAMGAGGTLRVALAADEVAADRALAHSTPAAMRASPSRTPAAAWTSRPSRASSSLSSPPRRWARAPAWASRWCTASSPTPRARSTWRARRGAAAASPSTCRASRRRRSPRTRAAARSRAARASACSWWTTRKRWSR